MDVIPIQQRPTRLTAAREAVRAVAKLDKLLDHLQPTDAEAHPSTRQAKTWASLVGQVARAGLRADEVLDAEEGLKLKEVKGGRGLRWEKRAGLLDPPKPSLNGNGHAEADSVCQVAGTVWIEGELLRVGRRLAGTNFWELRSE